MPKRVEWSVQGDTVKGRLHTPPGKRSRPAPLVVLLHGLSSSQVEHYDFPERLSSQTGLAVLTFDFRGHGESTGPRGVLSLERAQEDLEAGLAAMTGEYQVDATRIGLIGHSLGGGFAVCLAARMSQVATLVALAPIARLRYEMNPFEFAGYNLMRLVNAPIRLVKNSGIRVPYKVDYARLYDDPAAIERARRDDFLQHTLPVNNYRALVKRLDGAACARQVQVPTLVAVAEHDRVVKNASSRRVFDALPAVKKWMVVPKSGHSMAGDARSEFVVKIVSEFLQTHLLGVPAA